ncbi:MFS general substrate transporter [Durotheca rogersii]|uniref:MFS general substrate transporter n=1 Tax=Durotheca rogersii TaxID=419775 RepID=UPI00221E8316|nr:MFS general substrate transporter [Durotheca rogersii]KAI5868104.1 MFS general substrate transporter [Durotheca rogersii]
MSKESELFKSGKASDLEPEIKEASDSLGADTKGASPTSPAGTSKEALGDARDEGEGEVEDYGSTENHIFSDPVVAEHWRGVYERARYENRHRFDPDFRWTADEERRLVRKVDKRIMVWAWIMFCALDLHRRNINRAISDNMLAEIGMNTNDFNYGQTIFLACFLAAELPSGLVSKKLGADVWIPTIMVSWSIVAGSQAFLSNRAGFYAIKALLGLLMGGFIPDIVLWLTYFYKSRELPLRLAWFWTALSTVNIVGSLLAAGILRMRGINGWGGWRWLFLIEGIITIFVGIFSWGLMPPGPTQTRHWFRGRDGWFSEREELILVNRLLRDDPSKGDMNNRQAVGPTLLFKAVRDWEMWPLYLIGLTTYIPPAPPGSYLSYILRQLGFSVFEANLLAIPSQFLFAVNLLIVTWVSRRVGERAIVSSSSNIWIFPWVLALVLLPATASPWVRYGVLTGLLSYPYCHAILVGWNAHNSNAVRTRAVSAALYNMFVQSGNIIASNIYREDDQPLYRRGNRVLLGITVFNIALFYLVKGFYIWRNRIRERKWNAMTPEEQENYIVTTKDEGMQRLDFRFVH